jgi:predicted nucleic acid-binding protein
VLGRERHGKPIALADAQIAGICLSRGATLATRNAKDFAAIDSLVLTNPFDM